MSKTLSRRQLLKYSSQAAIGLSTFSLLNFCKQAFSFTPQDSNITTLEQQIPQLMKKAGVPGISVAIVKEGNLFWSKGFGVKNTRSKQPVNNNTIFAAASLSKPIFAYTVLKLCEQGHLNLDTPLTDYTDKPYIKDPRIKQITARKVLSHTTGFPNWSGNKPVWIARTPGTKFGYSGEGFLYLQKVVEGILRQPLSPYIENNCLFPLGMTNSSFVWRTDYESLATDGHDRKGNPQAMSKPKKAFSPGSLRTTATDYAQFLLAMMTVGSLDPQLTQNSLKEMLRPQIKISQSLDWGLGWGIEHAPDGDFFWHWGDSGNFKSFTLASAASQTGIAILTNSQNGLKICEPIVRLALGGQHPAFRFSMISY